MNNLTQVLPADCVVPDGVGWVDRGCSDGKPRFLVTRFDDGNFHEALIWAYLTWNEQIYIAARSSMHWKHKEYEIIKSGRTDWVHAKRAAEAWERLWLVLEEDNE